MQNIVIIGAGGFGLEVQWLIERINEKYKYTTGEPIWKLLGYIDDGVEIGTVIHEYPILGKVDDLLGYTSPLAVTCAIGAAKTRKRVIDKIKGNRNLSFPNLIDPCAQISKRIAWGKGNIVCAGSVITVDIKIPDFCIINLNSTIGHQVEMDSFVTVYPSVNVSGCVTVGKCTELGTGTQIIQGKTIGMGTIIGAGSVVVKDIPDECTAVGSPCRPIRFHALEAEKQSML